MKNEVSISSNEYQPIRFHRGRPSLASDEITKSDANQTRSEKLDLSDKRKNELIYQQVEGNTALINKN